MKSLHASIDVGSNSAKMLLASLEDGRLEPLVERIGTPRLGETGPGGEASPEALRRLESVLVRFRQTLSNTGAKLERVVLTEAVRKMPDPEAVLDVVRKTLYAEPDVISGEAEAELTWLAVRIRHGAAGFACVDVGAGSTELSTRRSRLSVPMGALSLAKEFGSAPLLSEIRRTLRSRLDEFDFAPFAYRPVFVSGGSASALAAISLNLERFQPSDLEGFDVEEGLVDRTSARLHDLSDELRATLPGLGEGRANIVVPGLQMVSAVLERLHPVSTKVSALGLRYGVLARILLPAPEDPEEPEVIEPPQEPVKRRGRRSRS